jgi:hypothetical protein
MKTRIFIIALFFTVSAIIAKSQSKSYDTGIDGGPGLAIFYASSGLFSETGFSMSVVAGIFYQYNFNETVSLKSGINYERKGVQMENRFDQFPANGNLFYNFDYLTVPIMVKAYFGQNIWFFINAGPYVSYLINQSIFFNPETEALIS